MLSSWFVYLTSRFKKTTCYYIKSISNLAFHLNALFEHPDCFFKQGDLVLYERAILSAHNCTDHTRTVVIGANGQGICHTF